PWCRQLALQHVPTWAGFVARPHRTRRLPLELAHQPPHRVRLIRHGPRYRRLRVADQHCDEEVFLVRIDSDVRGNVFHDRLLSSAALAPRALTRDHGGMTTLSSATALRRYDSEPVTPYCLNCLSARLSAAASRRPAAPARRASRDRARA